MCHILLSQILLLSNEDILKLQTLIVQIDRNIVFLAILKLK